LIGVLSSYWYYGYSELILIRLTAGRCPESRKGACRILSFWFYNYVVLDKCLNSLGFGRLVQEWLAMNCSPWLESSFSFEGMSLYSCHCQLPGTAAQVPRVFCVSQVGIAVGRAQCLGLQEPVLPLWDRLPVWSLGPPGFFSLVAPVDTKAGWKQGFFMSIYFFLYMVVASGLWWKAIWAIGKIIKSTKHEFENL
jgi:hypothetical protein